MVEDARGVDGAVILVGTETGTAEDVADHLTAVLEEPGIEMEIVDMEEALSKEGYKKLLKHAECPVLVI